MEDHPARQPNETPKSILLTLLAAVPLVATVSRSHAEEVKPAAPVTRDVFYRAGNGAIALKGGFDGLIRRGVEHQLKALDYTKLVDFFRKRANPFAAGEFWGKTVRAACLSYQYRPDPELKRILDATVADLLSAQTPDGCISTRSYPEQPKQSDLWDRKYVLLGLLGYYEINPDPKVLQAMVRLADYTLSQIGPAPKIRIVDTGWAFEGIESSSILEPIVKLYALTGFPRYLGFARYIVETEGACKRGSIFEAAFRGVAPKDIQQQRQSEAKHRQSLRVHVLFRGAAGVLPDDRQSPLETGRRELLQRHPEPGNHHSGIGWRPRGL